MIIFEGVVPGYHWPACLGEYLHEIELGSDEGLEVGELVVHSVACCRLSGSIVEDLHADNSEDVVDDHEQRHEAGCNWDDNDDGSQHLLEVFDDLGLFVHHFVLAYDLGQFSEPNNPQKLEHGRVDNITGEHINEKTNHNRGTVHGIPLSIHIILQPITNDPNKYIQQKHIREYLIQKAKQLILTIDAEECINNT